MSKFLNICNSIEKYLKEEGELPEFEQASPGEPIQQSNLNIDPETDTQVRDVSNEDFEKLIETMIGFFQKGKALSTESIQEINNLPSKINSENSQDTVDSLIAIFQKNSFPEPVETSE